MIYTLPKTIELDGTEVPIMWDYRPVLDIMCALTDPELEESDRIFTAMYIFYPTFEEIRPECMQQAAERMAWFINGGTNDTDKKKLPKMVDWEQDFPLIIAPVNRVIGYDVREPKPLHWWTFLSSYMEIGDCTFAQVVRIRDLKSRGKKMDKLDREWYNRNRDLVDFKRKYTNEENDFLRHWGGTSNQKINENEKS